MTHPYKLMDLQCILLLEQRGEREEIIRQRGTHHVLVDREFGCLRSIVKSVLGAAAASGETLDVASPSHLAVFVRSGAAWPAAAAELRRSRSPPWRCSTARPSSTPRLRRRVLQVPLLPGRSQLRVRASPLSPLMLVAPGLFGFCSR